MRLAITIALVLSTVAAAATACGTWNVKPECKAAYDNCVDGCGARCGGGRGGAGPGDNLTTGPDMSDTWTQECSACEYGCRDTRDRCNEAPK